MNEQKQSHRRGPKPKDEALVLRDQYWALFVKSKFPDESYASLERVLCPHLNIKRREDLLGYSQPFSLSKIAKGERGLSAALGDPPHLVVRSEILAPGAREAFTSILWTALIQPVRSTHEGIQCGSIAHEVVRRLTAVHHSLNPASHAGFRLLNERGIRRLSRLRHRDALGLLLWYCPAVTKASRLSVTAEAYVFHLLNKCCDKDPALMKIKDGLIRLICERFRIRDKTSQCKNDKIFLGPRVSSFAVGLRLLIDP